MENQNEGTAGGPASVVGEPPVAKCVVGLLRLRDVYLFALGLFLQAGVRGRGCLAGLYVSRRGRAPHRADPLSPLPRSDLGPLADAPMDAFLGNGLYGPTDDCVSRFGGLLDERGHWLMAPASLVIWGLADLGLLACRGDLPECRPKIVSLLASAMRIALVHHWLLTWRGGERVLAEIARLYPDAPIYTLFGSAEHLPGGLADHTSHSSLLARGSAFSRGAAAALSSRAFVPLICEDLIW